MFQDGELGKGVLSWVLGADTSLLQYDTMS